MRHLCTAIILSAFLFNACKTKKDDSKAKGAGAPVIVDVIVAATQTVSNTIEANGSIVASESLELHPEISGRITYLNIPEGKRIGKGTVLARINDADIRAQINKIKVQLDLANITLQRYKKLIDIGGLNQADYDAALNQTSSYRADISVLQAELSKTILRAPFSGVIGLRQTSTGAFVTPASIIATLQKVDRVNVDFTVPDEYGNMIKKGAYVAVETNSSTKQRQRALIIATEPQLNTSTRNLLVRSALEGGGTFVNPGTFVKVYINGGTAQPSIMVPANAIIPEDINKLLVTVKNGKAVYVNIETGIRQAANVEVTKGVNAGDTIVVSGVLFTKPNAPVKVRSVRKLEETGQ